MPFTALANKVYKDPITIVWANSIKSNFDSVGPHGCRAWCHFDGGAATVTAIDAYNITNITDSGAGIYQLTFGTAFASTAYAIGGAGYQTASTQPGFIGPRNMSPGSIQISTIRSDLGTPVDMGIATFFAFGSGTGL